jgi:hypothetical protein
MIVKADFSEYAFFEFFLTVETLWGKAPKKSIDTP